MATFNPFAPSGARRAGPDVLAALPDPLRVPGDPIRRPGVARHCGATLLWLPLEPVAAPSVSLSAPTASTCRTVTLASPVPALPGVASILELSPLPFGIASVLRRLPGFPTFYFAPVLPTASFPTDDDVVAAGEVVSTSATAFVGMLFDDRVALAPDTWLDLIGTAMTGVDSAADVTAWRGLISTPAGRTLLVRDHVGRPAAGRQFTLTSSAGTVTATSDASGALPLPTSGDVQVMWQAANPVHALYESSLADAANRATSTRPGAALVVPSGLMRAHAQLFDAGQWFGDLPAGLDVNLGHIRPDSRLEPLVDGIAVFRRMLDDLTHAKGPGKGAHFAGWAFNDFPFDPADAEHTMFLDLVRSLEGNAGEAGDGARFLMDKYLVFSADAPTDAIEQLIVALLVAASEIALIVQTVSTKFRTDSAGFVAVMILDVAAAILAMGVGVQPLLDELEDKIDGSKDLAAAANAIRQGIALRARHPVSFADNAVGDVNVNPFGFEPKHFVESVGSWHQKFQVIRREADALGNEVIGYLGGIDINRNRLDTPGHHGRAWQSPTAIPVPAAPSPQVFHDVHARVTGPAAADVALTFERRWAFDTSRQPPAPIGSPPPRPVAFDTPAATDVTAVPPQPARHLVQVARSGYRPASGSSSTPLPWSPLGEAIIPQAITRAIRSASEYIYIEDQYFTPHDPYVHELLEASTRSPNLRLLIVVPTSSDQVFGDIRRREIFARLQDDPATGRGWGDRMIVGALVRRPVLAAPGRVASKGRLVLQQTVGPVGGDTEITLGPRSRLPSAVPFWLWVQGELMLAAEQRDDVTVNGIPSRKYLVRRSGAAEPLWGGQPRAHDVGAPVTLSQTTGIYVHTKSIMVDDMFVGIGSCNTNRRGFFHDGEITAFAVPEQLKASRENPALNLRTALWAEHLGLPPAMGRSLLADPLAAFELFRRPTLIGNRVSPFQALGITPEIGFPGESGTAMKLLALEGGVIAADLVPYVWNGFADPTTATDPDPQPGPQVGTV